MRIENEKLRMKDLGSMENILNEEFGFNKKLEMKSEERSIKEHATCSTHSSFRPTRTILHLSNLHLKRFLRDTSHRPETMRGPVPMYLPGSGLSAR